MIERKCVQCGKKFFIEDSEIEFFNKKNLSLPKRCKECRTKNRNNEKKKDNNINKYNKNENSRSAKENKFKYIDNDNADNKVTYNRDSDNKNVIEFEGNAEHAKKESSDSKSVWKTLIASFAVIIGLAGGWLGYNITNDTDSNVSSIQDETDIDSSISSSQSSNKSDNNISTVQNNNNLNSNKLSGQENTNSDKEKKTTVSYKFRNSKDLKDHFKKHGAEFGYENKEQYLEGANKVINSSDALHKLEKEDNDDVYYLESSNEFVIVSVDGYIRTYFKPNDGIEYYNRQ